MTDAERFATILAALPVQDATFLRAHLKADHSRAARLPQRDAAVREALALYAGMARKPAAQALAAELKRITATPHARGERADLLRRILSLTETGSLAWRRIHDIAPPAGATIVGTLHPAPATQAL